MGSRPLTVTHGAPLVTHGAPLLPARWVWRGRVGGNKGGWGRRMNNPSLGHQQQGEARGSRDLGCRCSWGLHAIKHITACT